MTWVMSAAVCGLILFVAWLDTKWNAKIEREVDARIRPGLDVLQAELDKMRAERLARPRRPLAEQAPAPDRTHREDQETDWLGRR